MSFLKKDWWANRCDVTVDYLVQLNRALSGNPSFNGKCMKNIYWILEIPLLYPIIEKDSQNLHNLFPKRQVVWSRLGLLSKGILGKDGWNTDHWLHAAALKCGFEIHGLNEQCLIGSDFIVECFSGSICRPEKVKERHIAIKVHGCGWYYKGCWTTEQRYAFGFKNCFNKYKTVCFL